MDGVWVREGIPMAAVRERHQREQAVAAALVTHDVPLISVIVVNFCQWQNTLQLSQQLSESLTQAAGLSEVQVVDNGPPDLELINTIERMEGCRVHRIGANVGFARGVNEAALRTTGEWLLLLNPDTAVPTGFLDSLAGLCRTLDDENPNIGIVGLSLAHADGSAQASSGNRPTFWRTIAGLFRPRRVRKCQHQPPEQRTNVDWVTGCGMLIRRRCWQQLRGFDPNFFLYYEDTDFCTRAIQLGWEVVYEPALGLRHLHPLHTRAVPPELRLMTRHALLAFASNYWPTRQRRTLAAIIWLEATFRGWLAAWRGQPIQPHHQLRSVAKDWWRNDIATALSRVEATAQQLHSIMADNSDGQ